VAHELKGRGALVTGGHGFAGSWLAKVLLESGAEVTVLDSASPALSGLGMQGVDSDVEVVDGDLRDAELCDRLLAERPIELVFHLAATTIVGDAASSPARAFDVNVRGTWTLLEACRVHDPAAVVVASSDKAYGPQDELPYREEAPLRPTAPYEASKAAADLIARSYWPSYGVPVAVTRFANLYGGGDMNFSRLVPEVVSAALDGRRPIIRSDGSPERDFLYVEDAAGAYLAIAAALEDGRGRGEAFNAGGGEPHPVREVVDRICEVAGSGVEPHYQGSGNPEGEIDRQFVDATKIRDVCGWEPEIGLEEGLRRTVEWYREHAEARAPAPA
jgi:CDP-glucose 4,6-dehydratase